MPKQTVRASWVSPLSLGLALVLASLSTGIGGWGTRPAEAASPAYDIHTVQRGESLWRVARSKGTTVAMIQELNGLSDPGRLVPGMNLLVPGSATKIYTVRAGDTLWHISKQLGVATSSLIALNRLDRPERLYPGQRLIYRTATSATPLVGRINAYLLPRGDDTDRQTVKNHAGHLSQVSLFHLPVQPDGSLGALKDEPAVGGALQGGVAPILVITNFRGPTFDPDLARRVLSDPRIRTRLIDSVMARLQIGPYAGLDVDFENLYPEDRQLYTDFIAGLGRKVRDQGYSFSVAMAPKTADRPGDAWVGFFDYEALAPLVDYFALMTYEWGWVGSRPMAVAPINQIRRVLEYATSLIPREKILMGVPLYGYDWELPDTRENRAVQIGPQEALALAVDKGSVIHWDDRSQTPYFRYRNDRGNQHEIWFEDARSVMAKYALAREFGVRGISYWVLGNAFPANWTVLQDYFTVDRT